MAIPDTEFTGQIPLFFTGFLSKPASALPKGAQWVVNFEGLNDVKEAILATAQLEPRMWKITEGLQALLNNEDYYKKGCLFVQAVNIPEESMVANPEGLQQNHFIRTTVGGGRNAYSGLQMTFLDTNISFVENIIRPWVITTARLGLVARPKGPTNYRQDITIYKLGVYSPKEPPFILRKYTFFGACPIEVSSEEWNYAPSSSPILREATFTYHYYTMEVPNSTAITKNNKVENVILATEKRVELRT